MSIYDNELLDNLNEISVGKMLVDRSAYYFFDVLNKEFPICGTQIDWSNIRLFYKKLRDENILSDFTSCISYLRINHLNKQDVLTIVYIGDSLTEYAYSLSFNDIEEFFSLVNEIPQHHYFMDANGTWCISVNMTGDFNFGFSMLSSSQ